jgi:hypothetical protein
MITSVERVNEISDLLQLLTEQEQNKLILGLKKQVIKINSKKITSPRRKKTLKKDPKQSIEELWTIIDQGGDTSNIPDPMAWEREQRIDRELPFYN